ncbi:hypothetical protein [Pseudomonas pergaminensis]|uniref:hypothetical protein n=1 Tax=Pseudomonas pergaminensis TaxID=2853159 RepID=UPI003F683126
MFTAYFLDAIAHGFAEVVVGVEDHATGVELDHGHGTADSGEFGVGFGECAGKTFDLLQVGFVMAVEHGQITLDSRRP